MVTCIYLRIHFIYLVSLVNVNEESVDEPLLKLLKCILADLSVSVP